MSKATTIKVENEWGAGYVGAPILPVEIRVERGGKAFAVYDARMGEPDAEFENVLALCAAHALNLDEVLEALVTTEAKALAADFVKEFGVVLDPAETDWDSEAWGSAMAGMGISQKKGVGDLWPVFQRALVEETERLVAEAA